MKATLQWLTNLASYDTQSKSLQPSLGLPTMASVHWSGLVNLLASVHWSGEFVGPSVYCWWMSLLLLRTLLVIGGIEVRPRLSPPRLVCVVRSRMAFHELVVCGGLHSLVL